MTTLDEAGMPIHWPMPVNRKGQGPCSTSDSDFVGWLCWCGDTTCEVFLGAFETVNARALIERLAMKAGQDFMNTAFQDWLLSQEPL